MTIVLNLYSDTSLAYCSFNKAPISLAIHVFLLLSLDTLLTGSKCVVGVATVHVRAAASLSALEELNRPSHLPL